MELYARGSNNLPIVNAACTVWNDYTDEVYVGVTDSGGCVSGVVSYFYFDYNNADSVAYNDFDIHMQIDDEKVSNSAFTVGWTASGGTDTLDLTSTVGTGEWGSEGEDPGEPSEGHKKKLGILRRWLSD